MAQFFLALETFAPIAPRRRWLVTAGLAFGTILTSYSVTLNEEIQITESESLSQGQNWNRQTEQSHSFGVQTTWEVGGEYAFGPTGGAKVSAKHEGTIDLLLSDVVMPQMSGPELARQLTTARPGLKVLFASGYTDETLVDHGMLDQALFVEKPFSAADLTSLVGRVLEARSAASLQD